MNRRGFLAAMLAAGAAPAIVKAANLMPVFVRRESGLLAPAAAEQFVITGIEQGSGNLLLTPAMITREALKILNLNLDKVSRIGGDFNGGPFRVGDVITVAGR